MTYIIRIAAIACVFMAAVVSASAQWTHGSYQINQVVSRFGNYVYSAGANGGYVEAVFPTGSDIFSEIAVEFSVSWTRPGPPVSGTLSYHGTLTGNAGAGSSASATVDSDSGSITKSTTTDGNPFNRTVNCGSKSIFANNLGALVVGKARVDKNTGSSGGSTAFVWTSL